MAYENKIQSKVTEHPMDEFAAMGNLTEMDNFGDQLADLLNALSTNVIIPVENEDELKQWAADHAGGERVYAEINGEFTIAEPAVESPSGPSDINLNSVGGIDMSSVDEGEVLTRGSEGVIGTPVNPDIPTEVFNHSDAPPSSPKTIDKSSYYHVARFTVSSGRGRSGSPSGANSNQPGGGSKEATIEFDLSNYSELKLYVGEGGNRPQGGVGYSDGSDGRHDNYSPGGGGGGSSAIVGVKSNGDEVLIIEVGGGGGGDSAEGYSGGPGGGPGGGVGYTGGNPGDVNTADGVTVVSEDVISENQITAFN